jgi:transaldolase/glucose-6-phosphate isomerase
VLDSTDPGAVLAQARRLDPARTLFIVATKSGTTAETLSFFKFFYNWTAAALGEEAAGEHFVAITDPGTRLTDIAQECDFRTTFANQPDIGGRYSALSYFGMVPAALIGLDLELLLDRALSAACDAEQCAGDSAGLVLGAVLSELAAAGHDKLTLVAPRAVTSFGDWVEQLIAESTGKEGKGILPVVGEPLGAPDVYGPDRLFVRFRLNGDPSPEARLEALRKAGHPVVEIDLRDRFDLSEQFFVWEMATAVAGHRMGINPFNQPNVEAAKVLARRMIDQYRETGRLPESSASPPTARELREFLAQAHPGDYIALQAYVQPTPQTDLVLQKLRRHLRDRYHLATTLGYGPRFLHSTGQLHKGDAGRGLFIQFTSDAPEDATIPDAPGAADSSITFGVLKAAQVLGDRRALIDAGRRVIHIHLGSDVACRLEQLVTNLT